MKKDVSVSSIRLLATTMVVVLHISQQLERLNPQLHILTDWLNLGLVLFFCMSGYLYSNRTISPMGGWILHRYKEIVLPSIITVISTLAVYSLYVAVPSVSIIGYSLLTALGFEAFVPKGWMFIQMWFLTYILACYFSVPFIQKIPVKKLNECQFWSILFLATVVFQGGAILAKKLLPIPMLSWGILLRFYLTYFLFRRYEDSNQQREVYQWLAVLSGVSLILVCVVRYILRLDGTLGAIAELFFIYSQTIIGTVLFYYLELFFQKHPIPEKLLKISDKYSYAVYLTHCLFIGYSTSIIFRCSNIVIGIVMAIIMTAVASFLLTEVADGLKKIIK